MQDIATIRRAVLQSLVNKDGLAAVARQMKKPARQINDMLAERKSFGEKVTREMERNYDPNRAPGWMDKIDFVIKHGDDSLVLIESKSPPTPWQKYLKADVATKVMIDFLLAAPGTPRPEWMSPALADMLENARSLVAERFPSSGQPTDYPTGTDAKTGRR